MSRRHCCAPSSLALALALAVIVAAGTACPPAVDAPGAGEGEGEGDAAEGEGEGDAGEGEGEGGEGEGEGEGGEGEGEGDGGPVGVGQEGDLCEDDAFCAPPLACGFVGSAGILEARCGAAGAGAATGQPCTDNAQCDHGLCLSVGLTESKMCSEPCDDDGDCAAVQTCELSSVSIGSDGGVLRVCRGNEELPPDPCEEDADCAASGRVCNDLSDAGGGNFELVCGFAGAGGGLGAPCAGGFENDAQCVTGLCDGDANGACTQACNSNDDCTGAAGFICTGGPFSNISGNVCGDVCVSNADCAGIAGRTCHLRDNAALNVVNLVCAPNVGPLAAGQTTNDIGQCQTAFALNEAGGGFICTQMCGGNGDCTNAGPLTSCETLNVPTPDNAGTQAIQACARP